MMQHLTVIENSLAATELEVVVDLARLWGRRLRRKSALARVGWVEVRADFGLMKMLG